MPLPQLRRALALALAILTLLLYWPVRNHDFLNYDDHLYVTENKTVQQGLTLEGVAWAFNAPHVSNWHPVTWLSHMLDCTLFGLDAGAHHVVNLLFHVANTVLLFLLFARLTGAVWPAALVAALFAWHPLHVESVAWVAERKDVLSTLFWLLTLGAYARYTERPGKVCYALALIWFTLGLMAKPMLVTLPFVLLLLDVWPLRRLPVAALRLTGTAPGQELGKIQNPKSKIQNLWRLITEKWPFFVLSAVFSIIALLTQRDVAMVPMQTLPLAVRFSNTLISYVRYVGKMWWPADLAVFYPYPESWPFWMAAAAAALLTLATWVAWRLARARPYLLVGWWWFLGTLVPVIGLVQVGSQSMADRYTYVPVIGLFIALAWGLTDLWSRRPRVRALLGAATSLGLLGCLTVTHAQIRHWENSITLFKRATQATRNNRVAHYNLGLALAKAGRTAEAIAQYHEVVRIDPENLGAINNLGNILERQGRHAEAAALFTAVLQIMPDDVDALNNLGLALAGAGKQEEAVASFRQALRLQPGFDKAHQNLALSLSELSRPEEAIPEFQAALAANPDFVEAHAALAFELMRHKRYAEAQAHYREALRLKPGFGQALTGLGLALAAQEKAAEAVGHFTEAARLQPKDPRIQLYLGSALSRLGRREAALACYRESFRLSPDWPPLLANYAWLLATAPEPGLRNGQLAVQLAERACELTQRQMVGALDALAAAQAETGRFADAAAIAQQALALAKAAGQEQLAAEIQNRIALYQAGLPYREKL